MSFSQVQICAPSEVTLYNQHDQTAIMSPSAISTPFIQPSYVAGYKNSAHNAKEVAKEMIGKALAERIEEIDQDNCEPGGEDAFFVADLGEVYRQHMRWKKNLPRVEPFYGKISFP